MQKFIIQKLDENFDVVEQVSQHTTYHEAMLALRSITQLGDYILVVVDSNGNQQLLCFR